MNAVFADQQDVSTIPDNPWLHQLVMNLFNNRQVNDLTHAQLRNMPLQYGASQPPSQSECHGVMYIDHTLLPGGLEQKSVRR